MLNFAVPWNRSVPPALVVLVVMGVLMGVLSGVPPAHAASPGPLRILMTGDSITQGFHGDYTWRYRLWREFRRQRVSADFVGSRSGPVVGAGFGSSSYLDPNFDRGHYAQVGTLLQAQAGRIGREIRSQTPDMIVLACGVNDLRHGATPAQAGQYLRNWIDSARQAKPDVRMILALVLNATDPQKPWLPQRIAEYNALVRTAAAELSTPLSPISVAETTRGWSVPTHTHDNLHPNPTGETLIAQRFAETFHRLGVLPQAPALYRYTTWNRQPRVRVVLRGRRAVLSWDSQAVSGVRVWMHRAGRRANFSAVIHRGSSLTTGRLARRSTYEFRVQLTRARMSTPLGYVTRIRVPRAHRR